MSSDQIPSMPPNMQALPPVLSAETAEAAAHDIINNNSHGSQTEFLQRMFYRLMERELYVQNRESELSKNFSNGQGRSK